jgi:G3E family GTPase
MQAKQGTKLLRVVFVGGFLGAGKTTLVGQLAENYTKKGLKVGILTNDAAQNLVDTQNLKGKGFAVEEVSGSCYCCAFDKMLDSIERLSKYQPDILLLEPVGSCTDLIATVLEPIKRLHATQFRAAPYMVLVDPRRAQQMLSPQGGFPKNTAYIYDKQLEEADVIVVNKIDNIPKQVADEVVELLHKKYPAARILTASAQTGAGLNEILSICESDKNTGLNLLSELDYDTYADGEAELGWLNSNVKLMASAPFDLGEILLDVLDHVSMRLKAQSAEIAHIKAIASVDDKPVALANVTQSGGKAELHQATVHSVSSAEITFNARAVIAPERLSHVIEECLNDECKKREVRYQINALHYLKPGRPAPVYRFSKK